MHFKVIALYTSVALYEIVVKYVVKYLVWWIEELFERHMYEYKICTPIEDVFGNSKSFWKSLKSLGYFFVLVFWFWVGFFFLLM